jgi:hypothetical protein
MGVNKPERNITVCVTYCMVGRTCLYLPYSWVEGIFCCTQTYYKIDICIETGKCPSIQTDLYRSCCNVNTVTPTKTKPPLCFKKTGVRFLQVNLTKMSYIGTLLKGWSIHQFRQASLYSLIFLF